MENVYFFEPPFEKEVEQAVRSPEFRNLRIKLIECKELGSQRLGYFLYLRGRSEFMDRAEEVLKTWAVEKLRGDERAKVIEEFMSH